MPCRLLLSTLCRQVKVFLLLGCVSMGLENKFSWRDMHYEKSVALLHYAL